VVVLKQFRAAERDREVETEKNHSANIELRQVLVWCWPGYATVYCNGWIWNCKVGCSKGMCVLYSLNT